MRKSVALFTITLALAAMILTPSGGARAQDPREGPSEINQCQTISEPGSYRLVNNLTFTGPAQGPCLSITANFVTIDLAGFTISWPGPQAPGNSTTAIGAGNDTTGITVRNGSIAGFGYGVYLRGSNSIVEGVHVGFPCPCLTGITATGIVRGNTLASPAPPMGVSEFALLAS